MAKLSNKIIFLQLFLALIGLTMHANPSIDNTIISIDKIELSEMERAFLDNLGTVQVLVDNDFSPISYYDLESGEFKGIAVEVLDILSETLNFKYEILREPTLSWNNKLDEIKNNRVHILGGASKNSQRNEYGYFTETEYFRTNYALVGAINNYIYITDISQINNFRIGLLEGVSINNYILDNMEDKSRVIYYESKDEQFEALRRNEIDIVPKNEATFYEDFFKGNYFDFEIVFSIYKIQKKYAFFCPKTIEGETLANLLDKGMKNINLNRLISKHYNSQSIFSFYKEYTDKLNRNIYRRNIILLFIISFLFVVIIIGFFIKRQMKHKEILIHKLEKAIAEVHTLSGLLPICSQCKNIRDEKGYWKKIEAYIEENSDAQFSHALCEQCAEDLYGNEKWYKKFKKST